MTCECNARRGLQQASWVFQLLASLAWVVSVFIYNSWTVGDGFQLAAASAWAISNFLSLPEVFCCDDRNDNKHVAVPESDDTEEEMTPV